MEGGAGLQDSAAKGLNFGFGVTGWTNLEA